MVEMSQNLISVYLTEYINSVALRISGILPSLLHVVMVICFAL